MPEWIELSHDRIETQTLQSVLFRFEEDVVWIPKALIQEYDDTSVTVQYWFAEEQELEEYEI